MSQKKVDQYKQYKQNKNKIMKREQLQARIEISLFCIIMIAFVGWFCWSAYAKITAPDPNAPITATEVNMNAYADYVSGLQMSYN